MATTKSLTVALLLKAIDEMSGPLRQVAGNLKALDDAAGSMTKLREVGDSIRTMGQQSMLAGGAILASLAAPIAAFKDLETARTNAMMAFMTQGGVVDPVFARVAKTAQLLGTQLPGTTADFFEMAKSLKELGLSASAIADGGLQETANLRVLLDDLSPQDAAVIVSEFRKSLRVDESDFKALADYTQRARFAFGLDPNDFAYTLKYFGPLARELGMSGLTAGKDLLAFAGSMAQANIRGRMLGTSLREIADSLATVGQKSTKSKEYLEILGKHGLQLRFFDEKGSFLGFENMLAQIQKLHSLSQQERLLVARELFGQNAGSAIAEAATLGPKGFEEAKRVLDRQASIDDRTREKLTALSAQWQTTWGTLKNTLAAIGAPLGNDLKILLRGLNTVADAVGKLAAAHPTLIHALTLTAAIIGVLLVVLGGLAFALGTALVAVASSVVGYIALRVALGALSAMTLGATRAMWQFTTALLANPVGDLIVAIAALAASAYLIYRYWGPIKGFFSGIWQWVERGAGRMYDAGANLVHMLWSGIRSLASKPVEEFRTIVQRIRDHLPFSPAKVGPLKDLHRVKIVETLAAAMPAAPMVRAMRTALSASLAVPVIASASVPSARSRGAAMIALTYAPTVTLPAGAPADLKPLLEQMMRDHAEELRRIVEAAVDDHARTLYRDRGY